MATTQDMEEIIFGCCGAVVWLTQNFMIDHRKSGETFYCPNGHPRAFKETTADKLKKELDGVKRNLAEKDQKLTSLKAGKCPFCWRTVKHLSAHIKKYHP